MKRTVSALFLAILTASLSGCADPAENITPAEKGLQYIIVDGTTIDLTKGTEAVEAALGERFAVIEGSRLPEGTKADDILLTANIYDMEWSEYHFTEYSNKITNAPAVLYKNMPSDMTLDEFRTAYDGLYYDSYCFDSNKKVPTYDIIQVNGKVLTVSEIKDQMEREKVYDASASEHVIADYVSYRYLARGFYYGTSEDVVILKCRSDGQKCISYSLRYHVDNPSVTITD